MVFVAFLMLLYQNNHIRQKMTALPFRKNGVIPMVHRSDEDWNNPSATTKKCSFLSLRKSFLVYLLFSNKELRIDLPLVECHSFTFISSLKEPPSMKNIRSQTFSKHFASQVAPIVSVSTVSLRPAVLRPLPQRKKSSL